MRVILCSILLAACSSGRTESPEKRSKAAVSIVFPRLVGSWSGSVLLPKLGMATGLVNIDAGGVGTYLVLVAGVSRSGSVKVLSFSGTTLQAEVDGQWRTLDVHVQGNTLSTNVMGIGEVHATRNVAH